MFAKPIVDREVDRSKLPWSKAAWASMEDGEPAWVEFHLSAAHKGGSLHIYFHDESGPSHAYRVEVMPAGATAWQTVGSVKDNTDRNRSHALPTTPFTAIRVVQDAGGGSAGRPDLLWIAQVVLEK